VLVNGCVCVCVCGCNASLQSIQLKLERACVRACLWALRPLVT